MGEKNSGSGKPMKFYSLMAKVDESNAPYFQKSEKQGDHYEKTGTFDTLTGMITGAKIEEKEFKDGKKKFFVLFLQDEEATRKIQMSHNQISYSIINSLAGGIDGFSEYEICVYRKKSDDGKYYNGRAKVLRNGQKTEWNHNPQDAPKRDLITKKDGVTPILKDGKKQYDDEALKEFYEKLFTDVIVKAVGSGQMKSEDSSSAATTSEGNETSREDDLPF